MMVKIYNMLILGFLLVLTGAEAGIKNYEGQVSVGQKCNNAIDSFNTTSFDLTPYPPKKGAALGLALSGTFERDEVIKSLKFTLYYGTIKLSDQVFAQTGAYIKGEKGTFKANTSVSSISPVGKYTIQVGLINLSNEIINCWEVSFNL
jgi:ML domain